MLRGNGWRPRILSAIFSAIMIVGAFRLPVVMIGHPYPQTLAVLERELPKLKAQGIDWIDRKSVV